MGAAGCGGRWSVVTPVMADSWARAGFGGAETDRGTCGPPVLFFRYRLAAA
ncbi:hypothetical protein GCM10019016_021110 [Streptomyces prasinosporus]|uniref:GNAT family N-acetyltransferase n=1 Tax=Streptomyces prasinosporus TaxID=68256 RepID=A0ABP6TKX9_9ACTN